MIRLREHFKILHVTDESDVSSPAVIQHFYSYQLLLFDWHAPKIASCPPDDQQTTFYLYAAHIQHTHSKHPAVPPRKFTLNSSRSCVIVSLPDTHGTFRPQKPSWRDSLGQGGVGGSDTLLKKEAGATQSWLVQVLSILRNHNRPQLFDLLKFGAKFVYFVCWYFRQLYICPSTFMTRYLKTLLVPLPKRSCISVCLSVCLWFFSKTTQKVPNGFQCNF